MKTEQIVKRNTIKSLHQTLVEAQHGLRAVPGLLRQVLADDMWQKFDVELNREVIKDYEPKDFADFISRGPPFGVGSSLEMVKRICQDDKDVRDMIDREVNLMELKEKLPSDHAAYYATRDIPPGPIEVKEEPVPIVYTDKPTRSN